MVDWPRYLISPRNDISRTTPLLSYCWIFGCTLRCCKTLRRSHHSVHSKCSNSPNKARFCCGKSDIMKVLFFLIWPSIQPIREGETVANDQHQSLTHTLPALCQCEARPTPQGPQCPIIHFGINNLSQTYSVTCPVLNILFIYQVVS